MKRRDLFSALLAAPAAVAAVPAKEEPKYVMGYRGDSDQCVCGFSFRYHGHSYSEQYRTCANASCIMFGQPLEVPRFPLIPADPELVERVREREHKEREEQQIASFELNGITVRDGVITKVSANGPKIGDTITIRKPQRFTRRAA